jgi:hypothetical protein
MRTVLIALLASAALLTGCRHGRSAVEKLSPATLNASDSGVVVLTLGTDTKHKHYTELWLYESETKRPARPRPELIMDLIGMRGDFEGHHGSVNAFPLAPGRYYLQPFRHLVTARQLPTFEFEVRAGETTYLGELFLVYRSSREGNFLIRDHYERDMAVARAKNPAFGSRPVVKRLLRVGTPLIIPPRR